MEPAQSIASDRVSYWIGVLLVLLSAFCFATKGILIKLAYQHSIDALSLLTLRMLFALPFYALLAIYYTRRLPPARLSARQWGTLAVLGVLGYYVASYINFLGLEHIPASLERILLFTYPTFVLLMNAVGFGQRVSPIQWLSLGLTYAGILLAFLPNLTTDKSGAVWLGAFWVVLSGFVYAIFLVGSDGLIARIGSQRYTSYALLAATVPVVLHSALLNGLNLWNFPMPVYELSAGMALFVTVLPTFMMAEGIRRVGSSNTSIIGSIGPIFTIILATSLLHETISTLQFIGTAFVLTGVFLIGWRGRK